MNAEVWAVLGTTILVSAFLNPIPGGVSFELLRFAKDEAYALYISDEILDEVAQTLKTHEGIRRRYRYPDGFHQIVPTTPTASP